METYFIWKIMIKIHHDLILIIVSYVEHENAGHSIKGIKQKKKKTGQLRIKYVVLNFTYLLSMVS